MINKQRAEKILNTRDQGGNTVRDNLCKTMIAFWKNKSACGEHLFPEVFGSWDEPMFHLPLISSGFVEGDIDAVDTFISYINHNEMERLMEKLIYHIFKESKC